MMENKPPPSAADPPSYLEVTGTGADRSPSPVQPPFNPNLMPQPNAPAQIMAPSPMVVPMQPAMMQPAMMQPAMMQPMMVLPSTLPMVPVGPQSLHLVCPHCRAEVNTAIKKKPGLMAYVAGVGMFMMGCMLGCCLIPCFIPYLQDVDHTCPSCHSFLGTYSITGGGDGYNRYNQYNYPYGPQYGRGYIG